MIRTVRGANVAMRGTGAFIEGTTPSGRLRVINASGDTILFYASDPASAARRALFRTVDDFRRSEEYDCLSKQLDLLGVKYVKNYGRQNLVKMRAKYARLRKRLEADAVR